MNGTDISKKVYIIAEAGVNHNGSLNLAKKLVDAAAEAGADAVKFQTFKAEKEISPYAEQAEYQKKNTGQVESQLDMVKKLELPFEAFSELKGYADSLGIEFLSTPFEEESADFLEPLVRRYKIASGEIINIPLLRHIAEKGKPMIISTGMADLGEIEKAINTVRSANDELGLTLLHCTTNYPAPFDEVNLNAMNTLKAAFGLPVGYSDHTLGMEVPVAAVALGAVLIEKHFTLDKNMPGPDHKASLEPTELKNMISSIRHIEKALGSGCKVPAAGELEIRKVARKSITAAKKLDAGHRLTLQDMTLLRPGTGIAPGFLEVIVGMKLVKPVNMGEPLTWQHLGSATQL